VSLILYLILLFFSGLIVGALGRLALPGPDPMSIWATAGIGLLASLISGLVLYAITGSSTAGSFIVSVLVATGIVYLIRRRRGQSAWSTRRDSRQTRF
jgi:peptidoglycan/LPS O-acetylase OafA/YrhL